MSLLLSERSRWIAAAFLLSVVVHCESGSSTSPSPTDHARSIAIRLRVDVGTNAISMVAPDKAPLGASTSLVGTDGVQITTSNMTRTSGSQRSIVRFDVAITNNLAGVELVTPTFPVPPAGTTGLLLFPFETHVVQGKSSAINPTTDWDGAPYNFFNDTHCGGSPTSDCFPWEQFAAPLAPGATSQARTVGFEISNDVQVFDVVVLVAADLHNVPVPPAVIALSGNSASFSATDGVVDPGVASIQVTNSGGGTLSGLSVSYSPPPNWLIATLSSTTAPALLTLTPMMNLVRDGSYSTTITVSAPGVPDVQTLSVTMVVSGSAYANAIYVSESDPNAIDDATCGLGIFGSGTGNHPCKSIAQGLNRATITAKSEVRVADGHYTEAVTLVNGKNLLGGYRPDTWQRHLATTNTIIDGVSTAPGSNHDRTVIATNIASATVFEGFVVRGSVNMKAGGNSYAVYVANSGALVIRNNVIYGGAGGPGVAGADGIQTLAAVNGAGRNASTADAAYDAKSATGTGECSSSNDRSYANGGSTSYGGDNVSGGDGGGNRCTPANDFTQYSALDGAPGLAGDGPRGGPGGAGGLGGLDAQLDVVNFQSVCLLGPGPVLIRQIGTDGSPGSNGQNGAAAAGGPGTTGVAAGQWFATASANGASGSNGGGGGGGGAGGGVKSISSAVMKDQLGAHGGGGGSGGGGGAGGAGGSPGGAAFGIFIVGAGPTVTGNTIVQGTGGNGGNGGDGAVGRDGGLGAPGGIASSDVFCAGAAGKGGDGGKGGHGAGGAGGNGAPSFGIYTSAAGTVDYCGTTAGNVMSGGRGGSGGSGGLSLGNSGAAGVSGAVIACEFH